MNEPKRYKLSNFEKKQKEPTKIPLKPIQNQNSKTVSQDENNTKNNS